MAYKFDPSEIVLYVKIITAGTIFAWIYFYGLKRKKCFKPFKNLLAVSILSAFTGYFIFENLDLLPLYSSGLHIPEDIKFYAKLFLYSGLGMFTYNEIIKISRT